MKGLNSFAIDVEKEETGIWEDLGGMEFLIAKAGNKAWKDLFKKLEFAKFGKASRNKDRDPEVELDILIQCLAKTAILDWKNVTLDEKEIKYSKETAYEILSDKRFKLLTEALLDLALNQERFKEEMIAADEKK